MKNLTVEFMRPLLDDKRLRPYPKGQIVLYEGDRPPYVYFLKSGVIKMYDIDEEGNEKIIVVAGPGDIFPLMYALGTSKSVPKFYSTIVDSEIYTIDKNVFLKHIESENEFASKCLKWFSTEVQYLTDRMSSLEKTDTTAKLNFVIEHLLARHATPTEKGWYRVSFPVTQQLLADMVGITRESTNSALKEMQRDGLIRMAERQSLEIYKPKLMKLFR